MRDFEILSPKSDIIYQSPPLRDCGRGEEKSVSARGMEDSKETASIYIRTDTQSLAAHTDLHMF